MLKLEIIRQYVQTSSDIELFVKDIVGIKIKEGEIRYILPGEPKEVQIYKIKEGDEIFITEVQG